MTFPRYRALVKFWDDIPPADLSLAVQMRLGRFAKAAEPTIKRDKLGRPIGNDGKAMPPLISDTPGTMQDLFKMLKNSGKKNISF